MTAPLRRLTVADLRADALGPVRNGERQPLMVVADDHRAIATALSTLLARRFAVAVPIHDLELTEKAAGVISDGVLLLGLDFDGRSALDLIPELCDDNERLRVVVLTGHFNDITRQACLAAGAYAFVGKPEAASILFSAVEAAWSDILDGDAGGHAHQVPAPGTGHRAPGTRNVKGMTTVA